MVGFILHVSPRQIEQLMGFMNRMAGLILYVNPRQIEQLIRFVNGMAGLILYVNPSQIEQKWLPCVQARAEATFYHLKVAPVRAGTSGSNFLSS